MQVELWKTARSFVRTAVITGLLYALPGTFDAAPLRAQTPAVPPAPQTPPAQRRFVSLANERALLQNVRVSVDAAAAKPVRTILETMLKASRRRYHIAAEISATLAPLSLRAENVPLAPLLDIVCRKANLRWDTPLEATDDTARGGGITTQTVLRIRPMLSTRRKSAGGANAVPISVVSANPAGNQNSSPFRFLNLRDINSAPDRVLVNIDGDATDARTVIASVLKQSGIPHMLNADLPTAALTIQVGNVPLRLALNLLTEAVGAGWEQNIEFPTPTSTATEPDEPKQSIRVGRSVRTRINVRMNAPGAPGGGVVQFEMPVLPNVDEILRDTDEALRNMPGMSQYDFRKYDNYGNHLDSLYRLRVPERRATFTCPTTGEKTTVLLPTDTKPTCPTCKKSYPAAATQGHRYCPRDGAKLETPKPAWRFCPACGKPLDAHATPSAPKSKNQPPATPPKRGAAAAAWFLWQMPVCWREDAPHSRCWYG